MNSSEDTLAVIRGGVLNSAAIREVLEPPSQWEPELDHASYVEQKLLGARRSWRPSEEHFIVIDLDMVPVERSFEDNVRDLGNVDLALDVRTEALNELFARDYEQLARVVIDELERATPAAWRRVLVAASEHVQTRDAALRERLGRGLLTFAKEFASARDPSNEAALAAALRRYSAMIPEEQIDQLLPFLEASVPPRTKTLAAACVENVFSAAPPSRPQDVALRDRLLELVRTYAHPELISSSENAAIAVNAMAAIAAAFPETTPSVVELVRGLSGRPFLRIAVQRVQQVRSRWSSVRDERVVKILDDALVALRAI